MSVRSIPTVRFVPAGFFRAAGAELWARLGDMLRARRTRQMLGEMDDRMLSDIGVGRGDALMESSRSMWDLEQRLR